MTFADFLAWLGVSIPAFAALAWSIWVYFAGARKAELERVRAEVATLAADLKEHKEAGSASRAELAQRLAQVEQTLRTLPDKEAVHKLDIAVSEIRGDIREQSATMRAMTESVRTVAASGQRIEDYLLKAAGAMTDYATFVAEDCRLIILRTLAGETNGSLNEVLLQRSLETFGHVKTRDYVRTQLRYLAELGAVSLREPSETVMVATLMRLGQEHVERRAIIAGVARPSLGS